MSKHLYLFRHGETDWNAAQKFQGHTDIPLNELGRSQARRLIEPLRRMKIEAVLASDLSRARETGEIVAQALGLPVYHDARIKEANLGDAEGLTWDEIESKMGPETLEKWKSSFARDLDARYPNGETGREVLTRVLSSLEDFSRAQPFHSIGVATHGGVIRRVMHHLLPDGAPGVPIPNGILYGVHLDLDAKKWEILYHFSIA